MMSVPPMGNFGRTQKTFDQQINLKNVKKMRGISVGYSSQESWKIGNTTTVSLKTELCYSAYFPATLMPALNTQLNQYVNDGYLVT